MTNAFVPQIDASYFGQLTQHIHHTGLRSGTSTYTLVGNIKKLK